MNAIEIEERDREFCRNGYKDISLVVYRVELLLWLSLFGIAI